MLKSLLPYYEQELAFLRRSGAAFARAYPDVAGQLQISDDQVGDPHVERLIESVALMSARVQRRLDMELPEVTEDLLANIHPHLVRTVPARGIVQIAADFSALSGHPPVAVPARSRLLSVPVASGRESDSVACEFRTTTPTEVWPVELADAVVKPLVNTPLVGRGARGDLALELDLRGTDGFVFPTETMGRLRFHLVGDGAVSGRLYDLLFAGDEAERPNVWVVTDGTVVKAPGVTLHPCGFEPDEAYLDFDARMLPAHRVLFEYFTFPEKFAFFEFRGLETLSIAPTGAIRLFVTRPFDLDSIEAETLMAGVDHRSLRLNCVPVVNLMERSAEPIPLDHRTHVYPIVADVRRPDCFEVHAVTSVDRLRRGAKIERSPVPPLFAAFRDRAEAGNLAWQATRSEAEDGAHDVALKLIARTMDRDDSVGDRLDVRILASNRDLPMRIRGGTDTGDLSLQNPVGPIRQIRFVRRPRPPVRPPIGSATGWRMISLLSLNYVSLTGNGADSLRQMLKTYNLADRRRDKLLFDDIARQVDAVRSAEGSVMVGRIGPPGRAALVQGLSIDLQLDPDGFETASRVLFGHVLARFFALYATVNSFTETALRVGEAADPLKVWRPLPGLRPIA